MSQLLPSYGHVPLYESLIEITGSLEEAVLLSYLVQVYEHLGNDPGTQTMEYPEDRLSEAVCLNHKEFLKARNLLVAGGYLIYTDNKAEAGSGWYQLLVDNIVYQIHESEGQEAI